MSVWLRLDRVGEKRIIQACEPCCKGGGKCVGPDLASGVLRGVLCIRSLTTIGMGGARRDSHKFIVKWAMAGTV